MTLPSGAVELKKRLDAVICPLCTERRADGSCGLDRIEECSIATHLDALVYAAATVHSIRMDAYVDAVRKDICPTCQHRTSLGDGCNIREEGHCALDSYLMPALDVVDEFVADVEKRAGVGPSAESAERT